MFDVFQYLCRVIHVYLKGIKGIRRGLIPLQKIEMLKRSFVILLVAMVAVTPMFAQKFSKKEQQRREARAENFFYGASFTLTGGYLHSWLTEKEIDQNVEYFGKTEKWGQYRNSFNLGFQYDHLIKRHWGLQAGLFYAVKGGDHTEYYDSQLGYGPVLRQVVEEAKNQMIELQMQARAFLPVSQRGRFSLNGGMYIDRVFKSADGFGKWDLGVQAGVGYEWYHTSLSVTYQYSLLNPYIENSKSKQNALYVNIGYRLWK